MALSEGATPRAEEQERQFGLKDAVAAYVRGIGGKENFNEAHLLFMEGEFAERRKVTKEEVRAIVKQVIEST